MKIAIISDTHGFLHRNIDVYLKSCDEVWHAGDIGDFKTLDHLRKSYKLRAVFGNIDNDLIRRETKENLVFNIGKLKFLITHIAGKYPKFNSKTLTLINEHNPNVLVCGHSHILKIEKIDINNLLIINPGSCGKVGFHKKKTLVRFEINKSKIENMEVIELR